MDNIRNVALHSAPLIKVVQVVDNATTIIIVRARVHPVALKQKGENTAAKRRSAGCGISSMYCEVPRTWFSASICFIKIP